MRTAGPLTPQPFWHNARIHGQPGPRRFRDLAQRSGGCRAGPPAAGDSRSERTRRATHGVAGTARSRSCSTETLTPTRSFDGGPRHAAQSIGRPATPRPCCIYMNWRGTTPREPATRHVRVRALGHAPAQVAAGARSFWIKPLYYSGNAQGLRFASQTRALLAGGVDGARSPAGVASFSLGRATSPSLTRGTAISTRCRRGRSCAGTRVPNRRSRAIVTH